jgi:hypothetical protein
MLVRIQGGVRVLSLFPKRPNHLGPIKPPAQKVSGGCFPWGKAARAVRLNTHPHLVFILRMSGGMSPFSHVI